MPRSSRRDSSSIIPSQHQAQSFVITSCISQFTSQITAFLAFPSTIRSKRSNSWSLHQCESFHVLPSILRYFFFNTSFVVVNFHSLLESLKSVVVKLSSCHVFYVIKTTPFLSSPSPLNLFFPSTLHVFFYILLILMLRPSCLRAQVVITFQHRTSLQSCWTLSKPPLKKSSGQSGVLLRS